ncbi:MAG: aminotransferase class I/II-fold pyridoxal phosphate-dependent enzyme [Thermoanaerobaculia bacterium]|nr:aminotransferase class I/II-fold pyridoxal phosphate-dependent enzyme [Thermoanaerobaculia bacterium]
MKYEWWDWWQDRKDRYLIADEPFMDRERFASICVGTGLPEIHQKSTFAFRNVKDGADRFIGRSPQGEKPFARIYTRLGNPTTEYLEKVLFRLECQHMIDRALDADEKEPTVGSMVLASGMAAISTALIALLDSGDEVIAGNVYGCTDSLLRSLDRKFGIKTHFIDTTNVDEVRETLRKNPRVRVVFLESPENPNLRLADIRAIGRIARRHEALLIVDNTFCSSYLQQPFRLGADFVIQSMTKYVNGHSSSIGGSVLGPFPFMSGEFFNIAKDLGPTPSPFEGWLNGLCIQTLPQRIDEAAESAETIARWLDTHARIDKVYYPGLPEHPHHELVGTQMRNGGAMIAFEMIGGFEPAVRLMNFFARHDTPMELAVSLGSVISYIEHPASMTHAGVPEEARRERGITDGLVRLSVGLEGAQTLIQAFEEGFRIAYDEWETEEEEVADLSKINAMSMD